MLALRHDASPTLRLSTDEPTRASVGSRRNPASTRAILDAAAALLARDGLAGFNVDAIARLARCGKPTVYRWWPDKLALLTDLHARALAEMSAFAGIGGWADALHAFWSSTSAGPLVRAMVAEAQSSADGRARLRAALAPYAGAIDAGTDDLVRRAVVAQAMFAWLCAGDATYVNAPTTRPAAPPIESPIESSSPAPSLRHRGEWVD